MEQNFQTSFIPKKPMIEDRPTRQRSVGLLTIISIFILFTVLIVSAGLYFYQGVLTKKVATMDSQLSLAQNTFEPDEITKLQVLDKRLNAATQILGQHITISPVFQALQDLTMKTVRYTKFSYSLGTDASPQVTINLSGVATSYSSIALQSDLFTTNRSLIDPVFSNLSLDDQGNVLFDLQFMVDPSFVNYKATVASSS